MTYLLNVALQFQGKRLENLNEEEQKTVDYLINRAILLYNYGQLHLTDYASSLLKNESVKTEVGVINQVGVISQVRDRVDEKTKEEIDTMILNFEHAITTRSSVIIPKTREKIFVYVECLYVNAGWGVHHKLHNNTIIFEVEHYLIKG